MLVWLKWSNYVEVFYGMLDGMECEVSGNIFYRFKVLDYILYKCEKWFIFKGRFKLIIK